MAEIAGWTLYLVGALMTLLGFARLALAMASLTPADEGTKLGVVARAMVIAVPAAAFWFVFGWFSRTSRKVPLMVFAHRARVTAYAEEIKQQMEEQ